MILIYQMGKVASQSWRQAICELDPGGEPPLHVHHLASGPRARLAEILELAPPHQTIANRVMARDQQRKGTLALAQIEECRRRGEPIRIITGVRDPLPRSISSLLFLADFYDHVSRPLSARKGATARMVSDALAEFWASVFEAAEPRDSFEWAARYALGLYQSWFAEELRAVFGVDVLCDPFPHGASQRVSAPGVEVLVYRVEDMATQAPGHSGLLAEASAFLEQPLKTFPQINTSAARRSHTLAEHLQDTFRLAPDLIDTIYDHEVIRHFYRPEEVATFKARWRAPPEGA